MNHSAVSRVWMSTLLVAATLMGAACTTLPPAQPATDVKAVVGYWVGSARGRVSGAADFRVFEDGRYEGSLSGWPPSHGKVTVVDGKYRFFSETRKIGGTLTLHEGDGQRVLTLATDDGIFAEYRPAK